jgi:regulator of protease activity HflC (stomatin/prohibitin superfamily)
MSCNPYSEYYEVHGSCPPASTTSTAVQMGSSTPITHWLILGAIIVFALMVFFSSVRIIWQYERGVVFRFGKVVGLERQPGIRFKLPFIDTMVKVNVQIKALPLETQQVITKDSVSLTILAVVFYKVVDAIKSEVEIEAYEYAIEEYGQSVMRKLVGRHALEDILHSEEDIAERIKTELEATVSDWGIEITQIELKDIDLPESMRRAMAAKAESQREAEAKVIGAQGELDSSQILRDAADKLSPQALELRRLQVTREIAD